MTKAERLREIAARMRERAAKIYDANNAPDSHYHVAGDEPVDFVLDDTIMEWVNEIEAALSDTKPEREEEEREWVKRAGRQENGCQVTAGGLAADLGFPVAEPRKLLTCDVCGHEIMPGRLCLTCIKEIHGLTPKPGAPDGHMSAGNQAAQDSGASTDDAPEKATGHRQAHPSAVAEPKRGVEEKGTRRAQGESHKEET